MRCSAQRCSGVVIELLHVLEGRDLEATEGAVAGRPVREQADAVAGALEELLDVRLREAVDRGVVDRDRALEAPLLEHRTHEGVGDARDLTDAAPDIDLPRTVGVDVARVLGAVARLLRLGVQALGEDERDRELLELEEGEELGLAGRRDLAVLAELDRATRGPEAREKVIGAEGGVAVLVAVDLLRAPLLEEALLVGRLALAVHERGDHLVLRELVHQERRLLLAEDLVRDDLRAHADRGRSLLLLLGATAVLGGGVALDHAVTVRTVLRILHRRPR